MTTGAVGPTARTTSEVVDRAQPRIFGALSVEGYPPLLFAGWFWGICRWGCGFLGAYVANRMSHSARLVQLTGVAMWAPLLIGGVVGGVMSDRFDRRKTILTQFLLLTPLAALMGLAGVTGHLELWMVYLFLAFVGVGWVIDMTSRRAIIYDLVGPARLDNAMALESLSTSSGLALGTLLGGSAIQAVGVGSAFFCIAALLLASFILFTRVPHVERGVARSSDSGLTAFVAGFRLLRTERLLVSVLGVTAAVNFFFFSFTPLVQLVGTDLGVGAFLTGLLAAMVGFGMMGGSTFVARTQPRRRGLAYVVGSGVAMVLLVPFALSHWYLVSLLFLLMASAGMGLFGSTQSTLVMTSVSPELRGRALGLLSTAIGVLPMGMIGLGEVAQRIGARPAIMTSVICGGVVLILWLLYRPDVLSMTTEE